MLSIRVTIVILLLGCICDLAQTDNVEKELCLEHEILGNCDKKHKAICGKDGVTYKNICYFCVARKKKNYTLMYDHKGPCIVVKKQIMNLNKYMY